MSHCQRAEGAPRCTLTAFTPPQRHYRYAHYDGDASTCGDFTPFAGWTQPWAKQFTQVKVGRDLDALMATPCQKREWLACQSQAWMQHRVNEGLRTCAWLPAEHATTPRASCSSGNFTNLLKAPRILNEFTGCVSCSNRAKACVGPLQIDSSRKPYIWYGPFEFYLAL